MWGALVGSWSDSTGVPFPSFDSSTGKWLLAVRAKSERLMTLLQAFPHQHTLLNALSDEVVVAWTSLWRRVSILRSLQQYSYRLTDRATQNWIDRWRTRASRSPSGAFLAPVIDSTDDWVQLRARKYGSDELLKQCDVRNKWAFARHKLCDNSQCEHQSAHRKSSGRRWRHPISDPAPSYCTLST
uniref:Uncharacterized protein n=1 Tax=Hyaloperonospora arabidopsidis (strain Emoy2) TaxID=559515 RepID=M4BLB3_HYAAE